MNTIRKATGTIKTLSLVLGMVGTLGSNAMNAEESKGLASNDTREGAIKIAPYVFCGTGDHLWNHKVEPVDSPATIAAMFEWMAQTYKVKRIYWRGAQEEMWRRHYKTGDYHTHNLVADSIKWTHHVYKDLAANAAAVAAAKGNGMEIFMYTGLLEHGVQPDVGIIIPYMFEDTLRIDNPQWCPLDRWGQRRSPGPISFCYPDARKAIINRLMEDILAFGYDGVNFYTYVENQGIRYEDEFGFDQPIVHEFNKLYPNVNLRKDTLTRDQKQFWYKCRGKFVTAFLAQLRSQLVQNKKKLSMILDATEPDYAQKWWGKKLHGAGKIFMDWEKWIAEGIVDEIWVQLGPVQDQKNLLDRLLAKCKGKPVKLTVRAIDPLSPTWEPYVKRGVTPVAVITWEKNGIERITLKATSLQTLKNADWKLRAQTLADIAHKKLAATVQDVAPLTKDSQVLVRHRAVQALATIGGSDAIVLLETSLSDPESSVRIAAANSLIAINRPGTASHIFNALEKGEYFQFKLVAVSTLSALRKNALPVILRGLNSPSADVREVCVRTLDGKANTPEQDNQVYQALRKVMLNSKEQPAVRSWAIERLADGYMDFIEGIPENQRPLVPDLLSLIGTGAPVNVQLRAIEGLETMVKYMTPAQKTTVLATLEKAFRLYGDHCNRPDAAYGWRIVGNAILTFHGKDILEAMRKQTDDKWLAWNAYEVVHLFQARIIKDQDYIFNEVDEKQAVKDHEKYAPAFPGWRKW